MCKPLGQRLKVQIDNRHAKNLGGKADYKDTLWNKSSEKFLDTPGNLESQKLAKSRMYTQQRPERS